MNETSSKRGVRLSTTFKRIHDRLDASRSGPPGPDPDRRRKGNVPAVLGLVLLTAVTSWVVASISVKLVPVYMTAMVLIFAAPRTTRPQGSAADHPPDPESPPIEPAEGPEPNADDEPRGESSGLVEPPAADAGAEPPRPRKRRGKRKRSAKPVETDAAVGQVTWVRVGPGKFVRADVQDPEVEAPGEPASNPDEVDAMDEGGPLDPPTTEDETVESEIVEPLEAPGVPERPAFTEASEPGPTAEGYGITPSALGEDDSQEAAVFPEPADCEKAQPEAVAAASQSIPSATPTRDQGPMRPAVLLAPPTAEAKRRRHVGPVVASSGPRNVRRGDAPRSSTRNGRSADFRLRRHSVRIRSRLIHVERDYHPRSPPSRA